ncbi:autotransporter-associated beta strand repeat-containing protein [Dyella terrae]|uniref:autotransporter-associated beta strand repeat-containing protein n=1 Tax=Dyella terrae TaxID=522259 RepID=UPI001EFD415D|nr:autotransporter-associated beta strand repeat-containing protein [Dyella terrae]ULU24216.1 autotransporter-associated beta strand repeat-containing protein [Dyella terrae]
MNRIYRLVWNRALRVMQVASELTYAPRGGCTTTSVTLQRRRPLALACVTLLASTAWAAPAWSAVTCPTGAILINATGTTGGTGAPGTAGYGSSVNNATLCVASGASSNGGAGGAGAPGGMNPAGGGAGGAGGTGFNVSSLNTSLTNAGNIRGGAGGAGGGAYYAGGGGGSGGTGVNISGSGSSLNNGGTINGGVGGNGGTSTGGYGVARGGAGGAGVSGNGFSLTNGGVINGGNGGNGGTGGTVGNGGVGVVTTGGSSITNSNTIQGGKASGGTGAQADAVDLSGGGNTLTLQNGYTFTGNVISTSGTLNGGDTLVLGGVANGTFNASAIAPGQPTSYSGSTQYYGFNSYQVNGTGVWTLNGTTGALTPWTIKLGTLAVSSDGALGSTLGAVTLDQGGTLEATQSFVLSHALTLGANGGGNLRVDAGANLLVASPINGTSGNFNAEGPGILTLNANVSTSIGNQTYGVGQVMLGNNLSLTSASSITMRSPLDGGYSLAITAPMTTLGGTIGSSNALTSLSVTATTGATLGGNVSTSGAQTYNAAVTLDNNTTLSSSSGNVTLSSSVDGTYGLTIHAGGNAALGGAVGSLTPLNSLSVSGNSGITLGGNVTTTGAQIYSNGVTLLGNVTATSAGNGAINFSSTVNGNYALNANTGGAVSFGGAISGLTSLSTNSGSFTATNALNIAGPLSITTLNSAITQSQGFTVAGASSFSAGDAAITLNNISNQFTGAVSLSNTGANNVMLTNGGPLTLGNVTVGNGSLSLSGNGISQSASTAITQAASAGSITLNSGSAIALANTGNNFTGALSATGTAISLYNASNLTLGAINASGPLLLCSGGNIVQTGTGFIATPRMAGTSTGAMTLTSSNNSIAQLSNIAANGFSLTNGSALSVVGHVDGGSGGTSVSTTSGTLDISPASTVGTGTGTVALGAAGALSIEGAVNGNAVTLNAAGNTVLAGTMSASGASGTTINSGTLQVGSGGTTGTLTGNVTNNTGLIFNHSDNVSYAGAISGSGSLTQQGTGILTLTGDNTYSGVTTINAGTLALTGSGSIASSSIVNVASSGTLDISTTTSGASISSLGGSGNVTLGQQSLTLTAVNGPFYGVISGTGGLTVLNGPIFLTGNNTYTGLTTIGSAGFVWVGGGGQTGSIMGDVANDGAFEFDLTSNYTYGGIVSGAGQLVLQGTGTVTLTGINTYSGFTWIGTGTLALSGSGSIANSSFVDVNDSVFDISGTTAGASITSLTDNGSVVLGQRTLTLNNASGDANSNFSGTISGSGGVALQNGTETFSGVNTYSGITAINGGTLALSGSGSIASSSDVNVASAGTLDISTTTNGASISSLDGSGNITLGQQSLALTAANGSFSGVISGSGGVTLQAGAETLTGNNTYTGATTIGSPGTLTLGNGSTSGSIAGNVANSGALVFNRSDAVDFSGVISGTGTLTQAGSGTLTLDGNSGGFGGSTIVSSGTLVIGSVAGNGAALGGNVTVDANATLRCHGTIGGNVDLLSGGIVEPGDSIGTLTVNGDFSAAQGSLLNFSFGAPGTTQQTLGSGDSIHVGGNLSLNGATLNITNAGGMGAGLYNLFGYSGTLTAANGGLTLGSAPAGEQLQLQYLTSQKQINLIDSTGFTLNAWNANGQASATQMGGGSGTWSATSPMWTTVTANLPNGAMQPQPGFALFGGTAGTVTVDSSAGSVSATGIQFAVNGYTLNGDTLTLVGSNGNAPVIRVGDGSSAGASMTARIDNIVAGSDGLTKADLGTLVLSGANTYTGGTTINGGTLSISSDANLGNAAVGITFQGGTLENTTAFFTTRSMNLAGNGTLQTDADLLASGTIDGSGALTKSGAGTLTLLGANTYTGSTTISAGTLALAGPGSIADSSNVNIASNATFDIAGTSGASIVSLGGSGNVLLGLRSLTLTQANGSFAGVIAGPGSLTLTGGTETLSGTNAYSGITAINGGTLALSGAGSIAHSSDVNVAANATFDISGTKNGASIVSLDGSGNVNLGQQSLTLTQGSGSFGGVIGGTGGLIMQNGSQVLTGVNTYSGVTSITGGTLALSGHGSLASSSDVNVTGSALFDISGTTNGASIVSLDGSGNVNLGRQSLTLTGAKGSFSGVIGGVGGLNLAGGTEILTGTNTFAGTTAIGSGSTLQIGNGGTTGSIAGNVTNNGSLVFNRSNAVNFARAISGAGALTQSGSGTLTLSGANTYAGSTTISAGTLALSGNGSIAQSSSVNVAGNASFDISGTTSGASIVSLNGSGNVSLGQQSLALTQANGSFGGVIGGSGELILQGGTESLTGANTYTGGTVINAGTLKGNTVSLQGNIVDNGNLEFDQASDGIYAGVLSGAGNFTKSGTGMLVLNGQNSFTGVTSITAGTLEVGDAATPGASLGGAVNVGNQGTLRGHGTINGNVVNNGVVRPGGSIGTLTINGNFTQTSTGQFQVDTAADGTGSRLVVNGAVSLGGSALLILPSSDWKANTNYELLTATGPITGQFATVSSNFAFVNPTLQYGQNDIGLTLARNNVTFPSVAGTPNAKAVASAAESLGAGQAVYDTVVTLDNATAVKAFEQLQGDIHASTRTAILENDRYVRDAIGAHLQGVSNHATSQTASNDAGVTAWTSAWGHWGSHDSNDNTTALDSNGSGVVVGADLGVAGNSRLGTILGSGQGTARSTTPDTSAHHLDTYAGLYGDTTLGAVRLQGGAVYGWQKINTSRTLAFGNVNGNADSRYNANTTQVFADASYEFALGRSTIAPFANIAYDRISTDAVHENGNVAALDVASDDSTVTVSTLGVRGSFQLDDRGGLRANVSAGWQHASGDVTPVANERFAAGGNVFSVSGVPLAKNAAAISGGISFQVTPSVTVDATYGGQFGHQATDQSARMSLTWMF